MTFSILAARPDAVTWQPGSDNAVTVTMRHVADALAESIVTGTTTLAGHAVDESDLIELMNAMRRAAGLTQCDRCNQWTDAGDLCEPCAQEVYDVRMEQLRDRQQEWTR